MSIEHTQASIFKYQFKIEINRDVKTVWASMFSEVDRWWMKDHRALGEGSTMYFSTDPGGALLEIGHKGETLEWYRVQICVPGQSIYLVGHLAPDWGGPTTSMLKLALAPNQEHGCTLTVEDALLGNVNETKAASAKTGWQDILEKGLKQFIED